MERISRSYTATHVALGEQRNFGHHVAVHPIEEGSLHVTREHMRDLSEVKASVSGEEELVVVEQLLPRDGWQFVQADELVDLLQLILVPAARRVSLVKHLKRQPGRNVRTNLRVVKRVGPVG